MWINSWTLSIMVMWLYKSHEGLSSCATLLVRLLVLQTVTVTDVLCLSTCRETETQHIFHQCCDTMKTVGLEESKVTFTQTIEWKGVYRISSATADKLTACPQIPALIGNSADQSPNPSSQVFAIHHLKENLVVHKFFSSRKVLHLIWYHISVPFNIFWKNILSKTIT